MRTNNEPWRDLELLEAVTADRQVTQRKLSTRLNIALGLTNLYLKRLTRKGYIKCVNVNPNRILYLITPKGLAEKARLTYLYMDYSLGLYKEVRAHLRRVLQPVARNEAVRIAIYGTGEAAELAYLSLKELGLEPAEIYGDPGVGRFLGVPVKDLKFASSADFDYLLLTTGEKPSGLPSSSTLDGIPKSKLVSFHPQATTRP